MCCAILRWNAGTGPCRTIRVLVDAFMGRRSLDRYYRTIILLIYCIVGLLCCGMWVQLFCKPTSALVEEILEPSVPKDGNSFRRLHSTLLAPIFDSSAATLCYPIELTLSDNRIVDRYRYPPIGDLSLAHVLCCCIKNCNLFFTT